MLTAIVEADGRIRLPDEVREAARLEPGQEFEVVVDRDGMHLFSGGADDDVVYSDAFIRSLDEAEREGGSRLYVSTEEFLAALSDESHGR